MILLNTLLVTDGDTRESETGTTALNGPVLLLLLLLLLLPLLLLLLLLPLLLLLLLLPLLLMLQLLLLLPLLPCIDIICERSLMSILHKLLGFPSISDYIKYLIGD